MNQQEAHALYRLAQTDDFAVFREMLGQLEESSRQVLMVNEHELELRRQQGECRRHRRILGLLEEAGRMVREG
ncbi:hypothetical protein VSS37_03750 [Candidatus Thiothrix sp. Deng01]|uniref:DUF2383 domain-containing protein n=1 Tax=Candidatus Thiothrix phosphatis TaxID=3112415 RepID=A0ABU6CTE0_9GAMM|nr:hypothetical protein [Candidatus Thiothrix sp. Deng01]MEB4590085.1 hypothetical protein [Candidatus Thiothrix sp. Deng01]